MNNGSPLNVCPVMTLSRMDVDNAMIRPNSMMVWAFDDTKASACREIDLKILVSLYKFEISFVTVDIPVVFNLLLGRPWYIQQQLSHPVASKVKIYIRKLSHNCHD